MARMLKTMGMSAVKGTIAPKGKEFRLVLDARLPAKDVKRLTRCGNRRERS